MGNVETVARGPKDAHRYSEQDEDSDRDDVTAGTSEADDQALLRSYGRPPSAADALAMAAAVKRFYSVALEENAVSGCTMLGSELLEGLRAGGASEQAACRSLLAPLFREEHAQLVADQVSSMRVAVLRSNGGQGLAILEFRATPARQLLLQRERGVWKIDATSDGGMP